MLPVESSKPRLTSRRAAFQKPVIGTFPAGNDSEKGSGRIVKQCNIRRVLISCMNLIRCASIDAGSLTVVTGNSSVDGHQSVNSFSMIWKSQDRQIRCKTMQNFPTPERIRGTNYKLAMDLLFLEDQASGWTRRLSI